MSEIIFHNLVGKMMAVVERAKFRVGLKFKILFGYNTYVTGNEELFH